MPLSVAAIIGFGAVLPEDTPDGWRVTREDPSLVRVRRQMSRGAWLAALAVRDALATARDRVALDRTAAFLAVGASDGAMDDVLRILAAATEGGRLDVERFARRGVAACNPLLAFQLMNNFTLCHAAIREGLQGPNGAFFGGSAPDDAVAHALREGIRALEEVPWAIVGAADSLHHPVTRRERQDPRPPGEAAVALLLARETERALGWISVDTNGVVCVSGVEGDRSNVDCGAAGPTVGWGSALSRPAEAPMPRPRRTPPSERTAVITGVGAVSVFGAGITRLWDGLLSGAVDVAIAPHLPGFSPVAAVPEHERSGHRDPRVTFALAAAREAWIAAGSPPDLALSVALGLEQAWLEDFLPLVTPHGLDWTQDTPGLRYRAPLDLPARALVEALPISRARRIVHASACAGGALAVAHAAAWITSGEADRVLAGASDSMLNPLGMAGLQKLGVISPRGVCRPFDPRRDGIVVGEGAAFFVVEEEEAARRRGAPILARVAGWGSTQDGYAPTAPRPGGEPARRAMEAALRRARLDPADVGYVNAHGTGTPLNDEAEAEAIRALFGPEVPVGSFKGAIGHTMAAAGALELAGSLVAFARGMVPGTAGHDRPDPRCGLAVTTEVRPFAGGAIVSNSFGFGGQDASVVLVG